MPSQVELAAQRIAETLAPKPRGSVVLWRWATVEAVNDDGTMDVTIGGTSVPSLPALRSAAGASVGDRVRVDYLSADAVVTGVLADEPGESSAALTRGSAASSWSSADVLRSGRVVTVTINGMKLASALASGGTSGSITTIPTGYRPTDNLQRGVACISTTGNYANVWFVVSTTGGVAIANRSSLQIPTTAEISMQITYIID